MINVHGIKGTNYQLKTIINDKGGEGDIYFISEHLVAKVYRFERLQKDSLIAGLENKLIYLIGHPPQGDVINYIAWPIDLLYNNDNGAFCGFVMKNLGEYTQLGDIYQYPPIKYRYLDTKKKVTIARNVCDVIESIHSAGYIFGDFNSKNIGINPKSCYVAFFDMDTCRVEFTSLDTEIVHNCMVATPGYTAPELIREINRTTNYSCVTFTKESDNFALAIHIFRLLMNGQTPYCGINNYDIGTGLESTPNPGVGDAPIENDAYCFKPGNKPYSPYVPEISSLSATIQTLLKRAFIDGYRNPKSRPTPSEWKVALDEYGRMLNKHCIKDSTHYYISSLNSCPQCAAADRLAQSILRKQIPTTPVPLPVPITTPFQTIQYAPPQHFPSKKHSSKRRVLSCVIVILILLAVTAIIDPGIISDIKFNGPSNNFQTSIINNGTAVAITQYSGSGGALVIPSSINNLPVISIGNFTFNDCSSLTSVIIPDKVTTIGNFAFAGCTNLASITIPENVITIGAWAFMSCTNLASITIPENVTKIGTCPFEYCDNLLSIDVNKDNSHYASVDGVLYDKNVTALIECPSGKTSIRIPSTVTTINDYALISCQILTSVTIPDGVITIGQLAFRYCSSLTTIIIPDNVTMIGDWAFSECTGLTSVTIGDSLTSPGEGTFYDCSSLTTLVIRDGATSIGNDSFSYAPLTSVIIPNSVTTIGSNAFFDCSSMTSVIVGYHVATIGNESFALCQSLNTIRFDGNAPSVGSDWVSLANSNELTVYYLKGATGFTTPTWNGFASVELAS